MWKSTKSSYIRPAVTATDAIQHDVEGIKKVLVDYTKIDINDIDSLLPNTLIRYAIHDKKNPGEILFRYGGAIKNITPAYIVLQSSSGSEWTVQKKNIVHVWKKLSRAAIRNKQQEIIDSKEEKIKQLEAQLETLSNFSDISLGSSKKERRKSKRVSFKI
jgi:hypothetical protein